MTERLPTCSVVIPTLDRPGQLAECLEALAAMDYPRDRLEVIVVDDGGDSELEPGLAAFRDPLDLRLLRQQQAGPGAARNTGAARARGELLAFTDDDCRPRPDWLRLLAERHLDAPDVALGGHTLNALTDNPFSATSQLVIDAGYAHHNHDRVDAGFLTSNNLAVPAAAFRELGGFDERFRTSEDRDFCHRWRESGRRIHYVPDAVVLHAHRLTLRGFWRQHFRYGRGAYRFHREHRIRTGRRIPLEPTFYLGVHRRAVRISGLEHSLRIQIALGVWHLANACGFVWGWIRGAGTRGSGWTPDAA